jgi:Tol biopolymer transport system component
MFCDVNSHKCTYDFWSESYEHPVWSPDGNTIFAHKGVTACDNVGCQKFALLHIPLIVIGHAVTFANQPLSPGRRIPLPEGSPCLTYRPTLSPDGSLMAVVHSGCFARSSRGVLVSAPSGANPVEFPGRDCQHMEWREDGQAIYCTEKNNLYLLTLADRKVTGVLGFEKTVTFDQFSFSKDGRWLAAELIENEKTHLHLVDLQATPLGPTADFKQITTIASDRWPAF